MAVDPLPYTVGLVADFITVGVYKAYHIHGLGFSSLKTHTLGY